MTVSSLRSIPFNGPIEIGLRALVLLTPAYPTSYSLQRLVMMDYILVHSDDIEGGPAGLHPQTPHRGGELLTRRAVLHEGLSLYQSRDLIECVYEPEGLFYRATERSAAFIDALDSRYVVGLRERASWICDAFSGTTDATLAAIVGEGVGRWGAEFTHESVLWADDSK